MSELKKELNLYGLTMVAIGACIGAGIFLTPAQIAENLHSPIWIIIVWATGGLVALTGALTFAELGALFPKSGGVYVFLKEAYGDLAAFLYGWVTLLVITSGAIAALSLGFAYYLGEIIPLTDVQEQMVAIAAIVVVTLINVLGVNVSQVFANVFTGLKLLGIAGVIILGLFVAYPEQHTMSFSFEETQPDLFSAFLLAFIGVFWSYGGWHHVSYIAGETKNPQRNIPLAMILGTLVVTATYVLTNLAYLYLLPVDAIAQADQVAAQAVSKVLPIGGLLIAVLVAISTFGSTGIYTLSAPRIYFAMASDGVFFKSIAKIHPKYRTPVNAIVIQSVVSVVLLLLWSTFKELITYVVFIDLLFMVLAAISIFIFRKKRPDQHRPYKTPLYPVIPLIFIVISGAFVINTLIEKPIESLTGLSVLVVGIGVYWIFFRQVAEDDKTVGQ